MFGQRSSVLAINGMCSSDSQCVSGNCQGNLCESSLGSKLFSLNTPEECIEASISNLASSSSSSGNSFPGRWVCTNVQANSTTFKSGCLYTSGPSLTNTPFTCTDYTAVSKLTTSKRLDSGSSKWILCRRAQGPNECGIVDNANGLLLLAVDGPFVPCVSQEEIHY